MTKVPCPVSGTAYEPARPLGGPRSAARGDPSALGRAPPSASGPAGAPETRLLWDGVSSSSPLRRTVAAQRLRVVGGVGGERGPPSGGAAWTPGHLSCRSRTAPPTVVFSEPRLGVRTSACRGHRLFVRLKRAGASARGPGRRCLGAHPAPSRSPCSPSSLGGKSTPSRLSVRLLLPESRAACGPRSSRLRRG